MYLQKNSFSEVGRKTSLYQQACSQKNKKYFLFTVFLIKIIVIYNCIKMRILVTPIFANTNLNETIKDETIKYILYWSEKYWFQWWGEGRSIFICNKCPESNCYHTYNRSLFGGDLSKFHAILFYGPYLTYYPETKKDMPKVRYPYQKYVYLSPESSDNNVECTDIFDGFWNWTVTYKLDSDILMRYLIIRDPNGTVVGPKKDMKWVENMKEVDQSILNQITTKKKAAAWFVSHCNTKRRRENIARDLNNSLQKYNLTVDIYGGCGNMTCPEGAESCDKILKQDYFFYLAFENSVAEDYISEKVLHGFNNTVVPIMFGGANYSRFLPPGSYIDVNDYKSTDELAQTMFALMTNITRYSQYFRWKPYYRYGDGHHNRYAETTCDLCAMLHDPAKFGTVSILKDFRNWWYPDYKKQCGGR